MFKSSSGCSTKLFGGWTLQTFPIATLFCPSDCVSLFNAKDISKLRDYANGASRHLVGSSLWWVESETDWLSSFATSRQIQRRLRQESKGLEVLIYFSLFYFAIFFFSIRYFYFFLNFFSRSPKRRAFYFTDVRCWSRPAGFFLCNPPPPHEVVYSMTQQDLTAAFKAKADSRSLGSTSPTPCTSSPDFIAMTSALSSRMRTPLFWVCDPHVNQ